MKSLLLASINDEYGDFKGVKYLTVNFQRLDILSPTYIASSASSTRSTSGTSPSHPQASNFYDKFFSFSLIDEVFRKLSIEIYYFHPLIKIFTPKIMEKLNKIQKNLFSFHLLKKISEKLWKILISNQRLSYNFYKKKSSTLKSSNLYYNTKKSSTSNLFQNNNNELYNSIYPRSFSSLISDTSSPSTTSFHNNTHEYSINKMKFQLHFLFNYHFNLIRSLTNYFHTYIHQDLWRNFLNSYEKTSSITELNSLFSNLIDNIYNIFYISSGSFSIFSGTSSNSSLKNKKLILIYCYKLLNIYNKLLSLLKYEESLIKKNNPDQDFLLLNEQYSTILQLFLELNKISNELKLFFQFLYEKNDSNFYHFSTYHKDLIEELLLAF